MSKKSALDEMAMELCDEVRFCDDRLGQYSDHEGNKDGPAWYFWNRGYSAFKKHCERAIRDHESAILTWKKFAKLNEGRR